MAELIISEEDVKARLISLGYEFDTSSEGERELLRLSLDKALFTVCEFCNISVIPEGLYHAVLDLAASEFLSFKLFSSVISGEDSFTGAGDVKSIKEGDAAVEFFSSDESSGGLRSVILSLEKTAKNSLYSARKLAF